jgi:PAS domain S-box-containing protein
MTPGASLSGTWQIPAFAYIEDYRIGGSWIRSSPQLERWWGYTVEESGTPNFWKTCLHSADRDRVLAEDERCERTLEPWHSTHRMLTRDGRTLWVRDEAVIVYDDTGEPRYWQGLSLDITDRTMAQLETTRRLAALDELKSSVLTAVSHELRTPLAAILGASLTLERAGGRMSEEATADLLRGLSSSARKLDRLLTNVLDLEQLDRGTIPLNRQPFRHRRPAGTGSSTLAERDPLATSLRLFDDGLAGPRQGGTNRRRAARQHRTAYPTGHPGVDPCRPSGHRPAPSGRGRRPGPAERYADVGVRALPPRRDRPWPGYRSLARPPPSPAARWHSMGRGPTRRRLITPSHLARAPTLTLTHFAMPSVAAPHKRTADPPRLTRIIPKLLPHTRQFPSPNGASASPHPET